MNINDVLAENYKNLLIDQAYEVDALLKKYVQLHDRRLKTAGTFQSLFKKIDFEEIFKEIDELYWDFEEKRVEIMGMSGDYSEYSTVQQKFYDVFDSYFSALFESVEMLHLISNKQNELSKGLGKDKLTLQENLNLEKKYKEKMQAYINLGDKLNKSFKIMSEEN